MRSLAGLDDFEAAPPDEVSLLGGVNTLLRQRRVVLLPGLFLGLVAVAFALLRPSMYTSTASFIPEARSVPTNLSGIAAQFGLALPTQESSESPQFYVDLLHSHGILGNAVDTRYAVRTDTGWATEDLVAAYRAKGENALVRREAAIKRLDHLLNTTVSAKTNVVTVNVSAPSALLARAINARLLALVNEFNLSKRQSRGRDERIFAEERLNEVKAQRRAAEDRLQSFLQANREYRNAPALSFQQQRLESDVNILRQLETSLQQAAEEARLNEVRDIPVITTIEAPELPIRPDSRGALKFGLLAFLLGTALGIAAAFMREALLRSKEAQSSELDEFNLLRHQTATDLLHPWHLFGRRPTG